MKGWRDIMWHFKITEHDITYNELKGKQKKDPPKDKSKIEVKRFLTKTFFIDSKKTCIACITFLRFYI